MPSIRVAAGRAVGGLALVGLLGLQPAGLFGDLFGDDGSAGAPPPSAPTTTQGWQQSGHLGAAKGRLRRGCHTYAYRYSVDPALPDWGLNTFLIGPRGGRLGNGAIMAGADPTSGTRTFELCRSSTRPGRFTITGQLGYYDYPDTHYGWITPTHFRLVAPRKRHHRRR